MHQPLDAIAPREAGNRTASMLAEAPDEFRVTPT